MKPTAFVINLDRRPERWQRTQELWAPYFDLVRFPAIDTPENGALGCKRSHFYLAQLHPWDCLIVLEDDAVPTQAFASTGLETIPAASFNVSLWDYCNLSPLLDLTSLNMPKARLLPTPSAYFWESSYSHNTSFCIYNHRSRELLWESLKSPLPVDMFLANNARCQWVPKQLLATQAPGPSDVGHNVDMQALYQASERLLDVEVCDGGRKTSKSKQDANRHSQH